MRSIDACVSNAKVKIHCKIEDFVNRLVRDSKNEFLVRDTLNEKKCKKGVKIQKVGPRAILASNSYDFWSDKRPLIIR